MEKVTHCFSTCVGRFYQNDFLTGSHDNSATMTKTVRPSALETLTYYWITLKQ